MKKWLWSVLALSALVIALAGHGHVDDPVVSTSACAMCGTSFATAPEGDVCALPTPRLVVHAAMVTPTCDAPATPVATLTVAPKTDPPVHLS